MACGCGKSKLSRTSTGTAQTVARTVSAPASNASRVEVAKTYQSATMRAPQGPVTGRRSV